MNPTHIYKTKPVEFLGSTYISNGQQYCTILMTNKEGRLQRQTIQLRHLSPYLNKPHCPDGDNYPLEDMNNPVCIACHKERQ
jgi:hypothetical protein